MPMRQGYQHPDDHLLLHFSQLIRVVVLYCLQYIKLRYTALCPIKIETSISLRSTCVLSPLKSTLSEPKLQHKLLHLITPDLAHQRGAIQ